MIGRIVFAVLCCLFVTASNAWADWFEQTSTAMTTRLELVFWHQDQAVAGKLTQLVIDEIDRIEARMSSYRPDSELSMLNQKAAGQPVPVSAELYSVLDQAQRVSRLSQGAFDITFSSAGYLYDFRKAMQPESTQLNAALTQIDYRNVELDASRQTVHFRRPGVRVDLGGIAKGYAVDHGIEILRQAGVEFARLSAGGDMRLLGDKHGQPWIVGIKDPRSEDRHAVVLPLSNVAVSTSGDYERFFIDKSGERVHHILSPKTGRPAQGIQSVTIIGPDAITTDGLSTAVFVLGVEQGLAMINSLAGIDAVIIDSQRKMHFSEGLAEPQIQ